MEEKKPKQVSQSAGAPNAIKGSQDGQTTIVVPAPEVRIDVHVASPWALLWLGGILVGACWLGLWWFHMIGMKRLRPYQRPTIRPED